MEPFTNTIGLGVPCLGLCVLNIAGRPPKLLSPVPGKLSMKIKLNLDPAEVPDFEQIAKTLSDGAAKDEITSEDLGYITSSLISLCAKGLILSPEKAEVLDQAVAITLMKSMTE